METADLIDALIGTRIIEGELAVKLKGHSNMSIRLLVGLLKKRRPLFATDAITSRG